MAVRRRVFFSFHYKADVARVAQVRNIGALEAKGCQPASDNDWEQLYKKWSRYSNTKLDSWSIDGRS